MIEEQEELSEMEKLIGNAQAIQDYFQLNETN